jgi:hypothetical protein
MVRHIPGYSIREVRHIFLNAGPGEAGRFRGAPAYAPLSHSEPIDRQGRPWETTAPDHAGQEEHEDGEIKNLS